jgi:hypothetical protein
MIRSACAAVSTFVTALICSVTPALAADAHWGDLPIPGGVPAARRVLDLGDSSGRFNASLLTDFSMRYARSDDWARTVAKFRRYLAVVDTIRQATNSATEGVAPPARSASGVEIDRFRELADALGIESHKVRGRVEYRVGTSPIARERSEWAGALGFDVEAIASRWTDGQPELFPMVTGHVPVPLPGIWKASDLNSPADFLRDPGTGLLYAALVALDDQTLVWFDNHRRVLDRMSRAPVIFATFARSLHVRDGVVVVPGGSPSAAAWTRLVGPSPAVPADFLPALLTSDGGSLAYFFDAVFHATGSMQAALVERVAGRPAAIDSLYDAFRGGVEGPSLFVRPLDRPVQDPAWTLSLIDLQGGRLHGPSWLPEILERVVTTRTWPVTARALPGTLPTGDIDWVFRWVYQRPDEQLARAKLLRFTERLDGLDRIAPDVAEAALRTAWELPALALTLERMGLNKAEIVARVGRSAYGLSRAGSRETIEPILARWQASLALLEQVSRLRHMQSGVLEPLVLSLADSALRPPGDVTDRLLHWTTETLLVALAPGGDAARLDGASLARLLAVDPRASTFVMWEGLAYERNPLRSAQRDVDALAAATTQPARADAAAVDRLHRQMDRGLKTPEDARNIATDFDAILTSLGRGMPHGPAAEGRPGPRLDLAPPAAKTGRAPSRPDDPTESDRQVSGVLGEAADALVQPLVYALAMTPLHQTPSLQADAWKVHELAPSDRTDQWWRAAWRPATQQVRSSGGSGLVGSWLLLDLSLGEARVPRQFDQAATMAEPFRDAIFSDVALRAESPDGHTDSAEEGLLKLARGRALVEQWKRSPMTSAAAGYPELDALGAVRRNLMAWSLVHEPDAVSGLTLTELATLGGAAERPRRVSTLSIDGCTCFAAAPEWTLEDLRPYWLLGLPAPFVTDVQLRVAELLVAAKLPVALTADVLPLVTADWLSHIEPYANFDWEAMYLWPKQLTASEVEGYVMQLIAGGVLIPAGEAAP